MDNITKFLMELGKGFAFVGREYTIPIEGTEEKIDLLFYHLYLHCYVVVEVKIVDFTSRDMYYEYRILVVYNFGNTISDYRCVICDF